MRNLVHPIDKPDRKTCSVRSRSYLFSEIKQHRVCPSKRESGEERSPVSGMESEVITADNKTCSERLKHEPEGKLRMAEKGTHGDQVVKTSN